MFNNFKEDDDLLIENVGEESDISFKNEKTNEDNEDNETGIDYVDIDSEDDDLVLDNTISEMGNSMILERSSSQNNPIFTEKMSNNFKEDDDLLIENVGEESDISFKNEKTNEDNETGIDYVDIVSEDNDLVLDNTISEMGNSMVIERFSSQNNPIFTSIISNNLDHTELAEFFVRNLLGQYDVSLNENLEEEIAMFSDDHEPYNPGDEYYFNSEEYILLIENNNEFFQPLTLTEAAEKQVKFNLLHFKGREHLSWKREYVNSLPDELKYRLWTRILNDKNLELKIRLESLEIFLDERTKFFSFIAYPSFSDTCRHFTGKPCIIYQYILKSIPSLAPNIETIDLSHLSCNTNSLKEDFKFLFKTCTKLKSLRLNGGCINCPILDLISTDFNSLDKEVKIGLQAITIYNPYRDFPIDTLNIPFALSKLSNIFIRLPNLESLGTDLELGPVIKEYVQFHDTSLNLTVIYDNETNLSTLEIFAKFCPKLKSIRLSYPKKKVVENLYILPLLTEIDLEYFENNEFINYLTRNGNKIKKLRMSNDRPRIDEQLLKQLCPNLENYNYLDDDDENEE